MEAKELVQRKYIDLFAGCGGLSLGLEKAGFDLALAVEKSDMAAETFFHNFVERISNPEDWQQFSSSSTSVHEQAAKKLVVKELAEVLKNEPLLESLRSQDIDLIAGGPPCQGFSLAGRRNPEDVRNKLPWQFLELVESVEPKAVLIENVSGMSQDFRKHGRSSPFNDLRIALTETGPGYIVQPMHLNAMHFGVPQHRPRVFMVGVRADIARRLSLSVSQDTWRSEYDHTPSSRFSHRPSLAPTATHFGDAILTVSTAISDLGRRGYSRKRSVSEFAHEMRNDTRWGVCENENGSRNRNLENHVLRRHAPHIEARFRVYQYFRDQGVHPRIIAVPKSEELTDEGKRISIMAALENARFPAKAPDGTEIAQDIVELTDLVMGLGTKKHSQRPLKWDAPSPTVVSLPDDYVHPQEPRTLTVRELARFQSFPDAFEFRAKETTGSMRRRFEVPQYTQVGNAVPPKLAEAVGRHIRTILSFA